MIEVDLDLRGIDRALLKLRNPDLRPAWKRARKPLKADQRARQKQGVTPEGSPWPARATSTIDRDKRSGRRASRALLGRLVNATSITAEHTRAILSSVVRWAPVQFSGGTAGHGARIPGRKFLGVSDGVLRDIAGFVSEVIVDSLRKGR